MPEILIGTSGWDYDHWVGPFYPEGTKPADFLSFYGERLDAVEINNTFYHLPSAATVDGWRRASPPSMIFACKASRYITHMKKLKDPDRTLGKFLAVVDRLGDRAGPVLFQLPPRWNADVGRLRDFLAALPSGRRYAFEFRDESWFGTEIYEALADRNAAFCIYDLAGRRSPVERTADFAYVRLHGPDGPYRGSYDGRALHGWVRRFAGWRGKGSDVYCFFDNDENGYAANNALRMKEMIFHG